MKTTTRHASKVYPSGDFACRAANTLKRHAPKMVSCVFTLAFMAFMLAKPEYYLDSARKGLALFATSVLPSLFPFYFCSLLLTYSGAVGAISKLGEKPVKFMYNAPKECAYALFLSMLCGYPVGASTISELYEGGVITSRDAKKACAFCSTSGPIFMIGTIGGAIFHDTRVGWIVLCSHYLGAIVNGLLYRKKADAQPTVHTLAANDVDGILSKVVAKATVNMLYVGGYIVICGMLVDTLSLIGFDNTTSSLPSLLGQSLNAIVYGLIEMTRGGIACAKIDNLQLATSVACGIVSLGGLSVTLQNYTFLSKAGVGFFEMILRKITQCIISALLAYIIGFSL